MKSRIALPFMDSQSSEMRVRFRRRAKEYVVRRPESVLSEDRAQMAAPSALILALNFVMTVFVLFRMKVIADVHHRYKREKRIDLRW